MNAGIWRLGLIILAAAIIGGAMVIPASAGCTCVGSDCYGDLLVVGAGTVEVNGTYVLTDMSKGAPVYTGPNGFIMLRGGGNWSISRSGEGNPYSASDETDTPPATGWWSGAGSDPAPTMAGGEACVPGSPEIDVWRQGGIIADGDSDSIGAQAAGLLSLTYTIDNTAGTAQLSVTGVTASNSVNTSGFTVITALPLDVAAGVAATLQVSFTADAIGPFSLDMDITSNDLNESPYDITISGTVPLVLDVSLLVGDGSGAILDRGLGLPEGEAPPMVGLQPLVAVYEVGEPITGSCAIVDEDGTPLWGGWLHVYVYSVDVSVDPARVVLLDHWMAHYDRITGSYQIEVATETMAPGFYDIHLFSAGASTQTMRIQLVEPAG